MSVRGFTVSIATRIVIRDIAMRIRGREFAGDVADAKEPVRIAEIEIPFLECQIDGDIDDYAERVMRPKIGILAVLLMNAKRIYRLPPRTPNDYSALYDQFAVRGSLTEEPKTFKFEVAFAP